MIAARAVAWAVDIADRADHGYDQTHRWGPDYDCSSLVISAYEQAGTGVRAAGATYTGNMRTAFLSCGFADVTNTVSLPSGTGLVAGDVLLHEQNHTALCIGGGQIVHASGNEKGGIIGGQTGDQTGGEICVRSYYNYPWDCVLRYREDPASDLGAGSYVVQPGDTLWALAEQWLGSGLLYREIMEINALKTDRLQPGQLLRRPGSGETPEDTAATCLAELPVLRRGEQSAAVESMQLLLMANGYALPQYGADGEWGDETQSAMERFQRENGLTPGDCDGAAWAELIG